MGSLLARISWRGKQNVPQPTIHRIVVGESKDPKSNTLKKLASRWNITVAQLRGEEPLPPHLMTAAEGGEQIQEAGQGPRKGKEIKIRLSKGALQQQVEPFREMFDVIAFKRLKKRSDLPDWFPLEVYQQELSKRKWISSFRGNGSQLPRVRGFPTLGVLRLIRLPRHIRRAFPLTVLLRLPARLSSPTLRSRLTLCPDFPFRAFVSIYLTLDLPTARSAWGLPSSSTYLFLHATA
jgi:hypothetical protein